MRVSVLLPGLFALHDADRLLRTVGPSPSAARQLYPDHSRTPWKDLTVVGGIWTLGTRTQPKVRLPHPPRRDRNLQPDPETLSVTRDLTLALDV